MSLTNAISFDVEGFTKAGCTTGACAAIIKGIKNSKIIKNRLAGMIILYADSYCLTKRLAKPFEKYPLFTVIPVSC